MFSDGKRAEKKFFFFRPAYLLAGNKSHLVRFLGFTNQELFAFALDHHYVHCSSDEITAVDRRLARRYLGVKFSRQHHE